MTDTTAGTSLRHGLRPMRGRDPHESHRAASPLELFYDLTFAIAFGVTGTHTAHLLAEGHWGPALLGFGFAMFAIVWAWIGYTWLASAFDTDDWLFRVLTMTQMVGVLVLAVGLPSVFRSIDEGQRLANGTVVIGYVVMRVAQVLLWLRASRNVGSPLREGCLTYAVGIAVVQAGWVAFYLLHPRGAGVAVGWVVLVAAEAAVPVLGERRCGGTPWHPHHIAERYGCLALIALGECLIGTIGTLSALIEEGWTVDVALVGLAGTGLALCLWWVYFATPSGELLALRRDRSFRFGYGHLPLFAAIAGIGAGLDVCADWLDGGTEHISSAQVLLCVAVPVFVFTAVVLGLYRLLLGPSPIQLWLGLLVLVVLAGAVLLARGGVSLPVCLLVVTAAPLLLVVADEVVGTRWRDERLAELESAGPVTRAAAE